MKFALVALLGAVTAHKLHHKKADLPYTDDADKIDVVSRYVNDDDLVQIYRGDLPYSAESDKIDPVSRYVNDDDIVQVGEDVNLLQLHGVVRRADLPYTEDSDKVDLVSRYVNDDDI